MKPEHLEETVAKLVREVVPRRNAATKLAPSLKLQSDLGIDSFGIMTLAMRIEEQFGIDLQQHTAVVANVRTIGELCDALGAVLAGRAARGANQ
jgi:acyl carrier protein